MLIVLFVFSVILELCLYLLSVLWQLRKIVSIILIIDTGFLTGMIFASNLNLAGGLVLIIGIFRMINLLRIAENRMHPAYLKKATRRSGLIFMLLQTISLGLISLLMHFTLPTSYLLFGVSLSQFLAAGLIFLFTIYNVHQTRHRPLLEHYSDNDLPTITVAIPARNETADLEECLRTVLANDYPKLEILVLDDCSQDKTPEIIRSFAQDGVRFIPGDEPAERWLAKNQAYDRLAKEANGEYILFCGVDVRFGPDALRTLVTTLLNRKMKMISVLPLRTTGSLLSAFVQPTRYWWELALPRILVNRPPVLSTCWLINRQELEKQGGFGATSHAIIPEGVLARQLVKTRQYCFIRANEELDVQTRKKPADQRDTTVRTLYPQIRRRPEMALLLTLIDLCVLLAPFALAALSLYITLGIAGWLAIGAALLLTITHILIIRVSDPTNTIVAIVNLPLALLVELWLGLSSMWKYEFSTVLWKGRNVCIPVMHVIPRLPPLDEQTNADKL